jgi:putative flippase GtrA
MRRQGLHLRFSRYAALSFITVPAGYGLLLLARHLWDVNAGLLNLAVGTVLTPPSFLLYRSFVWHEAKTRSIPREMFSFWQTVMVGALVASACIALADHWGHGNSVAIVAAGLTGQGLVFLARFVWLDFFTFAPQPNRSGSNR